MAPDAAPHSGRLIALGVAFVALCLIEGAAFADAAGLPGGRVGGFSYGVYVPSTRAGTNRLPVLLVLHGCQQNAAEIRTLTRFDALAEQEAFIVVYPETGSAAGNPLGCWVWWEPENQRRGGGEPRDLVAIVRQVVRAANADPERVYVVGFSSGAAMTTILGAMYPDVIAAIGVHSGVSYAAGASAACALSVMRSGAPDPGGRGRIAYHAQGADHRIVPAMVLQGDDDDTVRPLNAHDIVARMTATFDLTDDGQIDGSFPGDEFEKPADGDSSERAYSITTHTDAAGRRVLVEITIDGMKHAWSGGATGSRFADPKGPDASRMLWQFLRQWSLADPPLQRAPPAACRERHGWNFGHFWWYRTMTYGEFACDPWGASWRRSYAGDWGPGRCE